MKKLIMRPAIAMIELIFALTVMGIVMLSIPNLLGMAMGSTYTSLQQEAIATAASDISIIMSREWDESNTNQNQGQPILSVGNPDIDIGIANENYIRTQQTNDESAPEPATLPNNLGTDADDADDIDDANGNEVKLIDVSDTKAGSIDTTITITSRVSYMFDGETAGNWDDSMVVNYNYPFNPAIQANSTNIKHISTTLISDEADTEMSELNKNITLFAFSCNIGGFKRERRVFE